MQNKTSIWEVTRAMLWKYGKITLHKAGRFCTYSVILVFLICLIQYISFCIGDLILYIDEDAFGLGEGVNRLNLGFNAILTLIIGIFILVFSYLLFWDLVARIKYLRREFIDRIENPWRYKEK